MEKTIQFLGLGFEVGQEKSGLVRSAEYMRSYFQILKLLGLKIDYQGHYSLAAKEEFPKIFSENTLLEWNWSLYRKAYQKIQCLLRSGPVLLNWGGDHSVALSTVGAFCSIHPQGYVLWIDAHADLNLPQYSLTGNFHGMPLSILLDLNEIRQRQFRWLQGGLNPSRLIYLGLRDLDPFEWSVIRSMGLRHYTSDDVRRRGMPSIATEILKLVGSSPLHVSFDIDSMDPSVAPSTGVSAEQGLTLDDLKILGSALSLCNSLTSLDVVEINPELGSPVEVETTYLTALSFLKALLLSCNHEFEIPETPRLAAQVGIL